MNQYPYVLFLCLLFFTACNSCYRTECMNGGTCIQGQCICEDGFSRPICEVDTCILTDACPDGIECKYGVCQCPDTLFGLACQFALPNVTTGTYHGDSDCEDYFDNTYMLAEVRGTSDPLVYEIDDFAFGEIEITFITETDFVIREQDIDGSIIVNDCEGSGSYVNETFSFHMDCNKDVGKSSCSHDLSLFY